MVALRSSRTFICNQKPVAKDTLGEDIQDSKENGLSIHIQLERDTTSGEDTVLSAHTHITLTKGGTYIGYKTLTNNVAPATVP